MPRWPSQSLRPLADRWDAKVKRTPGCWTWTGALDNNGYGKIQSGGGRETSKVLYAHRVGYELLVGPIPDGLTIDHLCRNKACVNPAHLEPVPHRVNILRSGGWTAERARATHCVNGHPFDEENTYHYQGWRACKECGRIRDRVRGHKRWLAELAKRV